jgi:hypothetical protein
LRTTNTTSQPWPLFDSFNINLDQHTVVISVFQITISPRHEGSTKGYSHNYDPCRRASQGGGPQCHVKVAYFLVCPEDGSQHQWQMPVDWNMNAKVNDLPYTRSRMSIHSQFCDDLVQRVQYLRRLLQYATNSPQRFIVKTPPRYNAANNMRMCLGSKYMCSMRPRYIDSVVSSQNHNQSIFSFVGGVKTVDGASCFVGCWIFLGSSLCWG